MLKIGNEEDGRGGRNDGKAEGDSAKSAEHRTRLSWSAERESVKSSQKRAGGNPKAALDATISDSMRLRISLT